MDKSKLQQLVAKVKKGQKPKEVDVKVKTYAKKITPPTRRDISVYMKENELRRKFFESLYANIDMMPDEEIKRYFDEFISEGDANRKIFIRGVGRAFDRDQLRKFAKTVTKYEDKYVDDLLKTYLMAHPDLKEIYDNYLEKKAKEKAFEYVERRYGKAEVPIFREQKGVEIPEDVARREFFKKITPLIDDGNFDEVIKSMERFANLGNTRRRAFFNLILNTLSGKHLVRFVKKINEENINEAEMFDNTVETQFLEYVNTSKKLKKRMNEAIGEFKFERIGETPNVVRERRFAKLLDVAGNEVNVVFETPKLVRERRFAKLLDVAGNKVNVDFNRIANLLDRTRPLIDRFAVYDYASRLWIPRYSATWIAPADGTALDYTFVNDNKKIVYNEKTYYKTNRLFDVMQVNQYSAKRQQKGDVLIFYDLNNKPQEVLVIHTTNGEFIPQDSEEVIPQDSEEVIPQDSEEVIPQDEKRHKQEVIPQDEKLFAAEKRWLSLKRSTFAARFDEFMSTKLFEFPEEGLNKIYTCITDTIVKNLGCTDVLANEILDAFVEASQDSDLKTFLENISGKVLIYLDASLFGAYAKDFQQRLKEGFYKVERLTDIRPDEIIPEVFGTSEDTEYIATLLTMIESARNYLVQKLGTQIYSSINPYDKEIRDPFRIYLAPPHIKPYSSLCKNDVSGIPSYRIITYNDGPDVYCFDVFEVVDMISRGVKENPLTGKEFSDSFLAYLKLFDKQTIQSLQVEKIIEKDGPIEIDVESIKNIENKFLQGLFDELDLLIEKIKGEKGEKEEEEERIQEAYYFKNPSDDPMDDEIDPPEDEETDPEDEDEDETDPEDEDETDPEDEDEDEDETDPEDEDETDPEDEDDDEETDPEDEMEEMDANPVDDANPGYEMTTPEEGLSCEKCDKQITNLKTIIKSGKDTTKLVNFCSIKCFESWNEPKKIY